MNNFEFDDRVAPTVPSTSWKNGWLLALCLLWCSTNLSYVPFYLHKLHASVIAAQALSPADAAQLAHTEAQLAKDAEENRYETEWTGNLPLAK